MKAHPHARFIFNHIVLTLLFFHMFSAQALAQFTDLNSPFKSPIKTITQDSQGFIWVASESSLAYFDGHQFRNIELKLKQSNHAIKITDMAFIADENLLIATQNHGLISHDLRDPHATARSVTVGDQTIYAIEASAEGHWIASQNGLYKLQDLNQVAFFPFPKSGLYINQIRYQQGQLLIASENQLLAFDTLKHSFQTVSYPLMDQTFYLWDIYFDTNQDLIISSNLGLYKRRGTGWLQLDLSDNKHVVRTLSTHNGQIWAGTTTHGLIRPAEIPGRDIKQFALSNSDISSDAITTLFVDQDNNMWVGFFDGSISLISNSALALGLNADVLNLNGCQEFTHEVTHFLEDKQFNLWVTTSNDVIKLDKNNGTCKPLKLPDHLSIDQQAPIPRILFTDVKGQMWVNYYRLGLLKINHSGTLDHDSLKPLYNPNKLFYQLVTQADESTFVFATSRGVITYDIETLVSTTVPSDGGGFENSIVYGSHPWSESQFLLATSRGVAVFDGKSVTGNELIQNQLPSKKIQSVYVDSLNNIWIGTADAGLFKFDSNMTLVSDFEFLSSQGLNNITSIIEDGQQHLWVSAESRLLKVNLSSNETEIFNTNDGLQAKSFNIGSAYKASNGKLYFGGMNGFNAFFPQQVNTDSTPPPVMITQLSRFNKPVEPLLDYEGFKINQPINFTDQLTWSHKDYVMSLEFAALDYRAPEQNQYAYQLEGFDPGWNYVDANNRKATYTDLPSGQYTFKVKGSNKYGVWNETGQSISIKVKPAPWLSWWAFLSYGLMLVFMVLFYINKKIRDSKKQAALLKIEVENKTQELQLQKQRVESLLVKKNELFSNVSHEFRTPLTLILGPLKELINQGHAAKDMATLTVINRNANRLLSLVEQLLQLARVSDAEKVHKSTQETMSQVESIVDSFQHMASNKKLKLSLLNNDAARIHVTDQCLDAILGNLISNAIKYTQTGGVVSVSAQTTADALVLTVKDSGAGLSETQQKDIFKRFKRLDSHQAIEGIGIGLTVVEEVVKINQGHIEVNSEVGVGSEFVVTLPLSDAMDVTSSQSNQSLIKQLASESPHADVIADNQEANNNNQLNQVLVIEDNRDMRQHIVDIIQPHYNILTAAHGKAGVAMAIEHIPDLIICDVMMPEMDGFKVSRIIRSDERTSHIPLVLLTALNDKTSRIKGWREHVDAYMTKPFDREELLIQLENMLTIRDILKKKTGQNILTNQDKAGNEHIALPQKDQQFINKLMQLIEAHYADPLLTLAKLADNMAVSDRQLQRKLKALTDQNPMDLLREFRLKKASELLKEGYQVSQIADNCGFNSLSYFSSCFKAQYGMPPKKYQQTTNS